MSLRTSRASAPASFRCASRRPLQHGDRIVEQPRRGPRFGCAAAGDGAAGVDLGQGGQREHAGRAASALRLARGFLSRGLQPGVAKQF
jgi:hypothetical protein